MTTTEDRTFIDGQGYVPALAEVTTQFGDTVRVGDPHRGWDVTNGGIHVGIVEQITHVGPQARDVRVSIRKPDGRTHTVYA